MKLVTFSHLASPPTNVDRVFAALGRLVTRVRIYMPFLVAAFTDLVVRPLLGARP